MPDIHFVPRKKRIRFEGRLDNPEDLIKMLSIITGVKSVTYKSNLVSVEYNLLEVRGSDIERKIIESGCILPAGFFQRIGRNLSNYFEKNEYESILFDMSQKSRNAPISCHGCALMDSCTKKGLE